MRTRRGKSSPWSRKYLTVAQADPVRVIGGKQQTNGLLDLGIGIEDDGLILCVEQTDRQRHESPLRDWLCGESRPSSEPAKYGARPPTSFLLTPTKDDR